MPDARDACGARDGRDSRCACGTRDIRGGRDASNGGGSRDGRDAREDGRLPGGSSAAGTTDAAGAGGEATGASADSSAPGAGASAGAGPFRVDVLETGASFMCGEGEYVLSAMLRARSGPISHGCCGGGCGVCRMRIVSGEWLAAKKMSRAHVSEAEQARGIALICCVQPRSDLTVTRL